MNPIIELDKSLFILINQQNYPDYIISIFQFLSEETLTSTLGIIFCIIIIAIYGRKEIKYHTSHRLIFLFIGGIITEIFSTLSKNVFDRYRPFEIINNIAVRTSDTPQDYSFPSSHTALAFYIAFFMTKQIPNKFVFMAFYSLAILIGISRIILGVHFPSDVFVGIILGTLTGVSTYFFEKRYLK